MLDSLMYCQYIGGNKVKVVIEEDIAVSPEHW
jgi:hypothetical protein